MGTLTTSSVPSVGILKTLPAPETGRVHPKFADAKSCGNIRYTVFLEFPTPDFEEVFCGGVGGPNCQPAWRFFGIRSQSPPKTTRKPELQATNRTIRSQRVANAFISCSRHADIHHTGPCLRPNPIKEGVMLFRERSASTTQEALIGIGRRSVPLLGAVACVVLMFCAMPAAAADPCVDGDSDGYVVNNGCDLQAGQQFGDCDDSNAAINPDATERCDRCDRYVIVLVARTTDIRISATTAHSVMATTAQRPIAWASTVGTSVRPSLAHSV